MVQWLRLQASIMGGMSSVPCQGTKILHATQLSQKFFLRKYLELNNKENFVSSKAVGYMCSRAHMPQLLSPCAADTAPMHLEPVLHNKRSQCNEKPAHCSKE